MPNAMRKPAAADASRMKAAKKSITQRVGATAVRVPKPQPTLADAAPMKTVKTRAGDAARKVKVPKPKPTPKSQQEQRRTYISALAAMCLEWVTIMSDVKARLSHQTWAQGLCVMLDTEVKGFQQLHETIYKSLEPSVETVKELQKLYRERAESSRQCTLAGDNMLGSKRKKFPSEPKCPCDAPRSDDAAGGDAGAADAVGEQLAQ